MVSDIYSCFSLQPSRKERTMSNAKSRWKILAQAIKSSDLTPKIQDERGLVRFPSYQLVLARPISAESTPALAEKGQRDWFLISSPHFPALQLKVAHVKANFSTQDLIGFNNTGNVCIWPSEECLAWFLLEHSHLFHGKSVLELGGGMTSLAGLILAQLGHPKRVVLTDGNPTSVENLELILKHNPQLKSKVDVQILKWNDIPPDMCGDFDLVLCSDCLFFDEYRNDLTQCIYQTLKPHGQAFVVAPSRNGTFYHFRDQCQERFEDVRHLEKYSEQVTRRQKVLTQDKVFNEDIHLPLMLQITKGFALKSTL